MGVMVISNAVLTAKGWTQTYTGDSTDSAKSSVDFLTLSMDGALWVTAMTVVVRYTNSSTSRTKSVTQTLSPAVRLINNASVILLDEYDPATGDPAESLSVRFSETTNKSAVRASVRYSQGAGILIQVTSVTITLTVSNGGGTNASCIVSPVDDWPEFPYTPATSTGDAEINNQCYYIGDMDGSYIPLQSRYWLPLWIRYRVTGNLTSAYFDFETGTYKSGSTNCYKIDMTNNRLQWIGTGPSPSGSAYGGRWMAICGHSNYYSGQLLQTYDSSTGQLKLISNSTFNTLYVLNRNYDISPLSDVPNTTKYIENMSDGLLITDTTTGSSHFGWNLQGTQSEFTPINAFTYANYNFGTCYLNLNLSGNGIMIPSPMWYDKTPYSTVSGSSFDILSSDSRTVLTNSDATQVLTTDRSVRRVYNKNAYPRRNASNLVPLPLHFYDDSDEEIIITYTPTSTGLHCVSGDSYLASVFGIDPDWLYCGDDSSDVFICYVYNSLRNMKSWIGDAETQLQDALAGFTRDLEAQNPTVATYFWVDNDLYGTTTSNWQTARMTSTWGRLNSVSLGTTNNQLTWNNQPLRTSSGQAVSPYTNIIYGEHYYTE